MIHVQLHCLLLLFTIVTISRSDFLSFIFLNWRDGNVCGPGMSCLLGLIIARSFLQLACLIAILDSCLAWFWFAYWHSPILLCSCSWSCWFPNWTVSGTENPFLFYKWFDTVESWIANLSIAIVFSQLTLVLAISYSNALYLAIAEFLLPFFSDISFVCLRLQQSDLHAQAIWIKVSLFVW